MTSQARTGASKIYNLQDIYLLLSIREPNSLIVAPRCKNVITFEVYPNANKLMDFIKSLHYTKISLHNENLLVYIGNTLITYQIFNDHDRELIKKAL